MDTQHTRSTVVVGVDGSANAMRAVRWGAAEARRRRIPLRLVIAFAWMVEHIAARPGREQRYRDTLLERARHHLSEAAAVAEHETPGIEVEQQLIVGHPMSVLVEEARRAQLMVIGDRGRGRVEGLLVGSVAVGLAVHAACPIIVVREAERPPAETMSWPVLVGVDSSSSSDAAVGFAFAAAATRRVPLMALHAWSELAFEPEMAAVMVGGKTAYVDPSGPNWDDVETDGRRRLSQQLAGWVQKYPDVEVEPVLVRGHPTHTLIEQATRAQLLVVGSRVRGEFSGLLLGSVSHALLHRAPCPIAVVRPDDRDDAMTAETVTVNTAGRGVGAP